MIDGEWYHLPMDRLDPNLHDVMECPGALVPIVTSQLDSRTWEIVTMNVALWKNKKKIRFCFVLIFVR